MNPQIEPANIPSETNTYLLFLLLALNQLDIAFTYYFIKHMGVSEANPLIEWVVTSYGMDGFILAKNAVVLAGCCFLFIYRDRMLSKVLIPIITTIYTALISYHLYFYLRILDL